ncbi:MAG: glycerol kinase GlpK [Erysipelotrichaceae bacterium]|nr:glycerol kinase GlpK [Erysipelotrichaceae bacterium]MDD4642394.1 glycerol kinase GlpK [Erysipelotrichaceae bacterium]
MMKYLLAIDQGTTSSRAIIFDENINLVAIASKEVTSYYPKLGWVEQNGDEIYTSVITVMYEVLSKADLKLKDITAIGITNQRETTLVWDKNTGKPVYFALVWQSRQTEELCEAMRKRNMDDKIKNKTGLIIDPYFSCSKIRWILDNIKDGQMRAEAGELMFGTIDTWLTYRLTGKKVFVTDVSNASRTQLLNINTLQWDDELLALWKIPLIMMPEVRSSSEIYGYTDPELLYDKVPIAAMIGDQQASLFGQTCFDAGDVKNTYGTGCFMLMNIGDHVKISQHGLITTVAWKIDDQIRYALEGSVFVAGAAIQWLRDGLQLINDAPSSEKAALAVSDNGGVYVVPAFVGLGAPYWDSTALGAIFGITRGTTRDHLIRATLESLAYQTYDVLKAMEADTGYGITSLKVDGGASRNDFLMQWQANILNADVNRALINETTALGAALLAGLAVKVWNSIDEIKEKWKNDIVFKPLMDRSDVDQLLTKWHKAVIATRSF